MILNRTYLFAAACGLSLCIAGCGGDSTDKPIDAAGPGGDADQPLPPDAPIVIQGQHHGYVFSEVLVPTTMAQQTMYGLDLGTATSNVPTTGGEIDNHLGGVFTALTGFEFELQPTITTSVDRGQIILLADVQTSDFTNTSGAGFSVRIGANPQPAACSDTTDTTCRHHLDGSGMFEVAPGTPATTALSGTIVNGTLNAGPGNLTLQIALGSTQPITLNLVSARVKATALTDTGMTAVIGGAILGTELNTTLLPAIFTQATAVIDQECGPVGDRVPTQDCSCTKDSTGSLLLGPFFNGDAPADCVLSFQELTSNGLIKEVLEPDVCSKTSCAVADAVSIGIKVTGVKASFPGLQ